MRIGNFEIVTKLGEGGMGEVYKGIDILLDRQVAIKALRPELAARPEIVERFLSEAVALAKLNHPNIATLYSFFQENDRYYMVLEFVAGEPLDKLIGRYHTLPWMDAVDLARQALAGLSHAHHEGIIHRDIKPGNMMLTKNLQLKLMDFGIARILQTARMTKTGHLIGTLEYMSPEQIQGQEVDPRSDIYSLGIVLYEMLSGRLPFQATTDYALIRQQVESVPLPVIKLATDIPARLNSAVMTALAKTPGERYDNATAFANELAEIVDATSRLPAAQKDIVPVIEAVETQSMAVPAARSPSQEGMPYARTQTAHKEPLLPKGAVVIRTIRQYPGIALSVFLLIIALAIVSVAWYQKLTTDSDPLSAAKSFSLPSPGIKQPLDLPGPPAVSGPKPERQDTLSSQRPTFEGSLTFPNKKTESEVPSTNLVDKSIPPVQQRFPTKPAKRKTVRKKKTQTPKPVTSSPSPIRPSQGWEIRK